MRAVLTAMTLACLGAQPVMAEVTTSPIFNFQGYTTEDVADPAKLAAEIGGCFPDGDKTSCTDYGDPVVGGQRMNWLTKKFYKGKLYYVFGTFRPFAASGILGAFEAKYGQPTESKVVKWQSKGGAIYDNQVFVWDFKGGSLQWDSVGMAVDEGSFEFYSKENAPPPPPAKVDF